MPLPATHYLHHAEYEFTNLSGDPQFPDQGEEPHTLAVQFIVDSEGYIDVTSVTLLGLPGYENKQIHLSSLDNIALYSELYSRLHEGEFDL